MSEQPHVRAIFLASLRAGLRGLPKPSVDEILADYELHFEDGLAQGRSESEIAAALGDPLLLADEWRADLHIGAWERERSPVAAPRLIAALLGLGVLNTLVTFVLAPLLALLALVVLISAGAVAAAGVWLLFDGTSLGLPGGGAALSLAGMGLIAASVSLLALLGLAAVGLAGAASRYVRLHYNLLPAKGRPFKKATP